MASESNIFRVVSEKPLKEIFDELGLGLEIKGDGIFRKGKRVANILESDATYLYILFAGIPFTENFCNSAHLQIFE